MTSYIEVEARVVLSACEEYLAYTDAYINELKEREVAKAMKPRTIFGFKLSSPTREAVIERLSADFFSQYSLAGLTFCEERYTIKQLKALCQVRTDSVINLSAKHAYILSSYFRS